MHLTASTAGAPLAVVWPQHLCTPPHELRSDVLLPQELPRHLQCTCILLSPQSMSPHPMSCLMVELVNSNGSQVCGYAKSVWEQVEVTKEN